MSGEQFVPPENFGMVEDDIYRFGCPNEYNFSFLEDLKLESVVYLAPTTVPAPFGTFLEEQRITLFHPVSIQETKDPWSTLSHDIVKEVLQFVTDKRNHPIAIVCPTGKHRTGTIVACLRKYQNWSNSSIIEEYTRYADLKIRPAIQNFIESFDATSLLE